MNLVPYKLNFFPDSNNFFFLWTFQLLSLFGSELTRFALPVWLFQQEDNLISFSIFVCCGLLPRIFSPILGGFIDCFNKKKILVVSGLSLVVISLSIISIVTGFLSKNFLFICILIFFIGIFSNLIHIGTLSIVPQTVNKDKLLKANSLMIAAESSAVLICPLLAGSLIFMFGISVVILTDIALFFISLMFLMKVSLKENQHPQTLKNIFYDIKINLKKGVAFIKKDRRLFILMIISGLINFIFSFSFVAFTPMVLLASQNDTQLLGRINSIGSGAQLVTSLLIGYLLKPNSPISLIMKSTIALGLCGPLIIGMKFSPVFWTIGYAATLALLSVINSANNAFWQTCTPLNLQGTIFGIRRMVSSAIAPFGTLLAGPLITWLLVSTKPTIVDSEYQMVFLIAGLLILFIGISGMSLKILKPTEPYLSAQNE